MALVPAVVQVMDVLPPAQPLPYPREYLVGSLLAGGKGSPLRWLSLGAYLCLSALRLSKRQLCRCMARKWQL